MRYHQVEMRSTGGGMSLQRTEMERVVEAPDNYYPEGWRVPDSTETYDWRPTASTSLPYRGEPHPAFAASEPAPVTPEEAFPVPAPTTPIVVTEPPAHGGA